MVSRHDKGRESRKMIQDYWRYTMSSYLLTWLLEVEVISTSTVSVGGPIGLSIISSNPTSVGEKWHINRDCNKSQMCLHCHHIGHHKPNCP